jgi:ABC-type transport system involved in multi-copper enzyme maturation permease subunit
MYARLWWKDLRQFWPIWVFLAVGAAIVQALVLHFAGASAREGFFGNLAVLYASLYALAVGAAAFAGERETGTLRLLDNLPVDRSVVWFGKVSFALVTTLALWLVLLAMAALATDQWNQGGSLGGWYIFGLALVVLVALGWGLFWSAILSNALTAAVTAICCTGLSAAVLITVLDVVSLSHYPLPLAMLWQALLIVGTILASGLDFVRTIGWRRVRVELRSPIVVSRTGQTSPSRPQAQLQSPVAMVLAPRPAAGTPVALPTEHSPARPRVVESRALAWQTMKEGGRTWCLLAAIGLVAPLLVYVRFGVLDLSIMMILSIGVALFAGANIFGLENRARTQRFLTHHGARPRLVWTVKLAIWSVGLTLIWGPLVLLLNRGAIQGPVGRNIEAIALVPLFFGIAQLCGMAIRRGITAVVIALVIGIALVIPLEALVVANMLSTLGILAVPVAILAISWAWSGDWLLERPAPGRWVRLGLLISAICAFLVAWYAGFRAWSIPDVGPIAPPAAWIEAQSKPLPDNQNAADLYREAVRRVVGPEKDSFNFLERNRDVVDLIRKAAARPDCRLIEPQKLTLLTRSDIPAIHGLSLLVSLDVEERQRRGDLAGAWNNIETLFRMAHHLGQGGGAGFALSGVALERKALGLAVEWAIAPGQTSERLHAALAAFDALPKMPTAADAVRGEANIVENTLDLPVKELRDWINESVLGSGPDPFQHAINAIALDFVTTPWERVRARRVIRLVSNAAIADIAREPWQRLGSPTDGLRDPVVRYAENSTPQLMRWLIPYTPWHVAAADQNEVMRRALVQVLAIRSWQLRHGGKFPDRLSALVPDDLPSLPIDPYSGSPFGYMPSSGQFVLSFEFATQGMRVGGPAMQPAPAGSWLLYSVGPDGGDDGGMAYKESHQWNELLDIVFAIPPIARDAGATKSPEGDATKATPTSGRPTPP